MKAILFGVMTLFVATTAAAQVGHDPAASPFQDLEYNQEIALLGGYVRARTDPAGIAPRSASMLGLRYELGLTGPLVLTSEMTGMFGSRNVLDPNRPAATRFIGTQSSKVFSADIGLGLNLTGRKSWNRLVPQIRGGIGFVGSRAKDDSSGYSFGTPFAFNFGGGLKFVPGGRWQLRADVTDRIFKLSYPDAYYRAASGNTAVLEVSTPKSFYTHHTALTVGVSYLFSR